MLKAERQTFAGLLQRPWQSLKASACTVSSENLVLLQSYMELCKKHPSFRERSENTDLAVN